MFLQGCAGDLAPFDWWFGNEQASRHGYEARDRLGRGIGAAALELYPAIETTADVRVAADSELLELRRRRHAYDEAEIRERLAEVEAQPRARLARGLGARGAHDDLGADVPARLPARRGCGCTST